MGIRSALGIPSCNSWEGKSPSTLIKGRTYLWNYEKYAARPEIGENEIRDFLRIKEFDQVDTSYLLKSWKGG
jgi:hypothetical protein